MVIKFHYKNLIASDNGDEIVENINRYMKVDPEFAKSTIQEASYDLELWNDTINLLTSINWKRKSSLDQYTGTFECQCSHGSRTRHNPSCNILYIYELNIENLRKPRVTVDQRIVNQVRYNQTKRRWEGLVCDPVKTSNGTLQVLSDEWIQTNLDEELVTKLKNRGKLNFRYNQIPPGNPRIDSRVPNHLSRADAPVMKYIQGQKNMCYRFIRKCFFYFNYESLAKHIHELGNVERANEITSLGLLSIT